MQTETCTDWFTLYMKSRLKITAKDIAITGMMIAIIEVAKNALAFIPNVELVSLLIILYTLYFGRKILLVIPAFILLEGCIYGFGLWWIMYLYVWPLLVLITYLFRKQESVFVWAIVSGGFGLAFGALCSIPYIVLSGPKAAFAWWVSGIPFDIVHCVANFVICLVFFKPLSKVLSRMK